MEEHPHGREARLAKNEAKARAENESRSGWFYGHERVAFVCECSDADCRELLSLDREMYDTLRESSTRFGVAVNHEESTVERVVKRYDEWCVVEKVGDAAEVAKQSVETIHVLRRQGEAPEVVKETIDREVVEKTAEGAGSEDSSGP